MTPVRLEPAALRSRVKHSTTEHLRSLKTSSTVHITHAILVEFRYYRPPDKSKEYVMETYFSYFSNKTYVVGTQKNHLNETVLLSTQNIY